MRHNNNGDVEHTDVLFEPNQRIQIQMVSRLIKHENLGLRVDNLGNGDTHSPTSREFLGLLVEFFLCETNSSQDADGLGLGLSMVDHLETLTDSGQSQGPLGLLVSVHVFFTLFAVLEMSKLLQQRLALHVAIEDVIEDGLIVSNNFLLDLENVNIHGEFLDLTTRDGINQ